MLVQLDRGVTAEVVPDLELKTLPRWHLRGLRVWLGPYRSTDQWVRHSVEAIGSSDVDALAGTDELLFHPVTRQLLSTCFIVPEVTLQANRTLNAWRSESPIYGLLRLAPAPPFSLEPADARWFAEDGSALAGFRDGSLIATAERLRLRIAQDVDLLFANRRLCGWWLSSPARYLVNSLDGPHPYPRSPDPVLISALSRYLELIADPYIEMMEKRDTSILQALVDLHSHLDPTGGAAIQRQVIREAIEDIVDQFYRQQLSQD